MRTGSFARVDLSRVVHDMVDLYDAAAEEAGVRLTDSSQGPVWAQGDHDLLASAIASLIDNAIKYAGAGSSVEVAARTESNSVCIVVRDNGPGVPTEELPRLTERFYRMDRARHQPGNGLGLAIVAATASLHSGKLRLTDANPGLRATLFLPAADAPPEPGRLTHAAAAESVATTGAANLSNR
jgi:signal transduction histidine kinase